MVSVRNLRSNRQLREASRGRAGADYGGDGVSQFPLLDRFLALPQDGKIAAEYVWIGGSGHDLRCKTKVLDKIPSKPEDLPIWNYDGSSTNQAPGA